MHAGNKPDHTLHFPHTPQIVVDQPGASAVRITLTGSGAVGLARERRIAMHQQQNCGIAQQTELDSFDTAQPMRCESQTQPEQQQEEQQQQLQRRRQQQRRQPELPLGCMASQGSLQSRQQRATPLTAVLSTLAEDTATNSQHAVNTALMCSSPVRLSVGNARVRVHGVPQLEPCR